MNDRPSDQPNFLNFHSQPTDIELRDQAQYLGIDPESEKDLLWIAKESWLSDLPQPWLPVEDECQNIYFFNPKTKQSMWEHPYDEFYRNIIHQERNGRSSRITNSSPEDSGIACTAAVQKAPLSSEMSKVGRGRLSNHLSVDFLSSSPVRFGGKHGMLSPVGRASTSEDVSPVPSTPRPTVPKYELPSSFGKSKFLKSERRDSDSKDEKKSDENLRPKVNFNVDLDDVSNISHYSYVETDESDSVKLDSTEVSKLMMNMDVDKFHLAQSSSDGSSLEKRPAYEFADRPSLIPGIYSTKSQDGSHSTSLKISDVIVPKDVPPQAKPESKSSEASNNSTKHSVESLLDDLRKRHKEVENQEEADHANRLENLRQSHYAVMTKLKESNGRRLEEERAAFDKMMRNLKEEMYMEQRKAIDDQLAQQISELKVSHDAQSALMKESLRMEVEELKRNQEDAIKMHSELKSKLLKSLEDETKEMEENFRQQIDKHRVTLSSQFADTKATIERENDRIVEQMKREHEDEVRALKIRHEREKDDLKRPEVGPVTDLSSSMNAKPDEVDLLKKELQNLKSSFEAEKQVLSRLQDDSNRHNLQRSSADGVHDSIQCPFMRGNASNTCRAPPMSCLPEFVPCHSECHCRHQRCQKCQAPPTPPLSNSNLQNVMEPVYAELRQISGRLQQSHDTQRSQPINNQKNFTRHEYNDSEQPDNDVTKIASSLLDVSNQLTDFLGNLNSKDFSPAPSPFRPFTPELPKLTSELIRVDDSSYTPVYYPYTSTPLDVTKIGPEVGVSTRHQLDQHKKWLQDFYKHRKF